MCISNCLAGVRRVINFTVLHLGMPRGLTPFSRRNGRTIHEEAEHIIKTHLAASGANED